MDMAVVGAGPAGLYAAIAWKTRHRDRRVVVYEQNAPGTTFGFGVVFSDRALDFLRDDDPETAALIEPHMMQWHDITLNLRNERIVIDGIGFSAIGRLSLLNMLRSRAEALGVELHYGEAVRSLRELQAFDIIVAADGVNSVIRTERADDFGVHFDVLTNKFAWFGAETEFDTLTQTFIDTPFGPFNAHHYSYAPQRSTFIVECGPDTWKRAGFDTRSEDEALRLCAQLFATTLNGASLVANRSIWRNFPFIFCERWWSGNVVLVGDALRTAHFSIGSGTRLALEDVIALMRALEAQPDDLPAALRAYQAARQPVVDKLVAASRRSADWYENFSAHMELGPADFAMSYLTRSGRIDSARLAVQSPRFAAWYDAAKSD